MQLNLTEKMLDFVNFCTFFFGPFGCGGFGKNRCNGNSLAGSINNCNKTAIKTIKFQTNALKTTNHLNIDKRTF